MKRVEGVIHTVSLSLSREPITWRASPFGVCDSNLSGACGGLTLSACCPLPPPLSLSPSTLANRGNYALNWHPVYTLNRHQLQLCDTRTNTSMLSLPLHFPRSFSVTHLPNGKEGCFGLTSSGGMSGWRCLWRRNTWVTGGYGAALEHLAFTGRGNN